MSAIGRRIKRMRQDHGWTQKELAEQSGLTQAAISDLESGITDVPQPRSLVALEEAFNVRPGTFYKRPKVVTPDPVDATFIVQRLRHLRTQKGLTQWDLARAAGVTQNVISEIEIGKNPNPRMSTVRKLAKALDVDEEETSELLAIFDSLDASDRTAVLRVARTLRDARMGVVEETA